ncbi:MAG TPA: DUF488 domain-containing protein [Thermoclostridium sp.]|nr:DUF488 domain-containing protein [Thermoclostridium sp.]
MKTIYTIGYSSYKVEDFVNVLKKYHITSLIDVRSYPNSKFFEDYNQGNIKKFLKSNGIIYRSYSSHFGARQEDKKYHKNGYMDFSAYVKSESFKEGMRKVEVGIDLNYVFVLMCAEKDPSFCHRSIMVAREFHKNGYEVKNISSNGSYKTQEQIAQSLVQHYFPNRNQTSFLSNSLTYDEMVEKAYQLRNSEIGYRLDVDIVDRISV